MQSSYPQRHQIRLIVGTVFALVMVVFLVACAPGGTATGQGTLSGNAPPTNIAPTTPSPVARRASQGTLNGYVVAGPTCPVEQAENPCPPNPVPGRIVLIETSDGQVVATATTNKNGYFSVSLAPGTYKVQVAAGASPWPVQRTPVQVTIVAGQMVSIQIEMDTGIR